MYVCMCLCFYGYRYVSSMHVCLRMCLCFKVWLCTPLRDSLKLRKTCLLVLKMAAWGLGHLGTTTRQASLLYFALHVDTCQSLANCQLTSNSGKIEVTKCSCAECSIALHGTPALGPMLWLVRKRRGTRGASAATTCHPQCRVLLYRGL